MNLIVKLLLLLVMLGLFVWLAVAPQPAYALPCCSVCDNNPRFCSHGCLPNC
jgi:hypothetical protein